MHARLSHFLVKTSLIASLSLFLLDFFSYSGAVANKFMIAPLWVALSVAAVHAAWRWRTGMHLPHASKALLLVALPLTLALALGTHLVELTSTYGVNYFRANVGIAIDVLPSLALAILPFSLVHLDWPWAKAQWRWLTLLSSLVLVAAAWLLFLTQPEVYASMTREDSLIENLTCVFFLAASVTAWLLWRQRTRFAPPGWERHLFAGGCLALALGFFLIAGEEISWGQRLLSLETPAQLQEVNRQGEINLHNTEWFWPYVYRAYQGLGLFGATAWLGWWVLKDLIPNKNWIDRWRRLLVPGPHLLLGFFMIVIYVWLREKHGPWRYQPWEEFSELLLAGAIALHLLEALSGLSQMADRKKRSRPALSKNS